MENFALVSLAENLKPAMADIIIRRIVQHQPGGFLFQTRSLRLPALKMIMDAQQPAVYASDSRPPIETPTGDFLMVLRKHLTSAEVVSLEKPLSERILEFAFKTAVPSRELETMFLVVELLPNAPNLILLDAERRVLSSFLPITPQHGIAEYEVYRYPSSGTKIGLEQILNGDPPELNGFGSQDKPEFWLMSHIAGIGPALAAEIVHRQKKSGRPIGEEIRATIAQVRSISRSAWLYTDLPLGHILETNDLRRLSKAVLSPIELESFERTHSSRLFTSILEAARFYFDEFENRTLLEQAKMPVLRDLREAGKRFAGREKRLLREQQKYGEAEGLQNTAQLLTSSGLNMDQHYDSATVTDYFADEPRQITIPLDSTMPLRENIELMFKRHQKSGRGKNLVGQQFASVRSRRAHLDEQLRRLHAIKDWDTWLAIKDRLDKERRSPGPETDGKEVAPRRFRSIQIEGREVLIGRNGRENDELTFQVAGPDDFWFHVAEYSGSHVIVRNPARDKELDETLLTKAAQLAAFFSQARNSSKVEVHYTRRKHVAKPRRARPGMVRLLEFKSISVEPKNWVEQ
jgi:predicted ribosome quality control (RQC) complex YloA/Tae2 family protein